MPSRLIDRQVAALILSLLVHVLELGESPQSKAVCGVEGEKGSAESLKFATDRLRPSFAVLVGVEGAPVFWPAFICGTAVGRALKKRCEYLDFSSMFTTTAAAPAVYAKIREEERLSKAVGEETVVPIIRFKESPDSYNPRVLLGDRGVRGKAALVGVILRPSPVFAMKVVRGLEGVEAIINPPWRQVKGPIE